MIHLLCAGLCAVPVAPQDVPRDVVAQEEFPGDGILGEGRGEGGDHVQAGLPSLAPCHSLPPPPALLNESHPLSERGVSQVEPLEGGDASGCGLSPIQFPG